VTIFTTDFDNGDGVILLKPIFRHAKCMRTRYNSMVNRRSVCVRLSDHIWPDYDLSLWPVYLESNKLIISCNFSEIPS